VLEAMKEEYADSCELSMEPGENGLRVLARIIARVHIARCLGASNRPVDTDVVRGEDKRPPIVDGDYDDE